jgi:3-methyladenine DNA glycosylase AlkC
MTLKELKIQLALGSLPEDDKLELASNKRTSKEILTILSKDKDWYIRFHVAYNSNTPKKVLTKLLKDKDYTVSSRADIHLNT